MFDLKSRGDIRYGCWFFRIDVLLKFFADLEYGLGVVDLNLYSFLECVGEAIQGVGQFLHMLEGVLRVQLRIWMGDTLK